MEYSFGYILNKKYVFIKYLNSGAFSDVWLLYDFKNDEYCVAKIINREDIETGKNETKILRKLKKLINLQSESINNQNILLFKEIIEKKSEIIIIEDYQDMNLKDLIYDYTLSSDEKKIIIELLKQQIKPILDFLKKNKILHTDIKPENIFLKHKKINSDEIEIYEYLIEEIKNLKCKQNEKIKEIKKLIVKYKEEDQYSDSSSYYDSDYETDSDILSDYDVEEEIKDFLDEKVNDYLNKNSEEKEDKKTINFDLKETVFSIGDFGNAIDYSEVKEFNKIKSQHYHDLQTRYYRHPNIIMRSFDILDSDYFAFELTLKEVENQSVFIDPIKSFKHTTDQEHLRLLINSGLKINCTKGRKSELFFNYDPLTKKYYLNQ